MAIRYSDAAAALIAGDCGLRRALANCSVTFYTGSQPTSANDSYGSSQPIINFSLSDGVMVYEVKGTAVFDVTGITTGETITSITVGGLEILGATVTYATSATNTASLIAAQINKYNGPLDINAVAVGTAITISAPRNCGTALNNATIVASGTGVWNGSASHFTSNGVAATANPHTYSSGNGRFATGAGGSTAGVAAANGLTFDVPYNNTDTIDISKPSTEVWSGYNGCGPATAAQTTVYSGIVNGTTYTAGWGRILCSAGDDGSTATSGTTGYIRVDFSVGTSGTDFIMGPTAGFVVDTTTPITSTINTFTLQIAKKMA